MGIRRSDFETPGDVSKFICMSMHGFVREDGYFSKEQSNTASCVRDKEKITSGYSPSFEKELAHTAATVRYVQCLSGANHLPKCKMPHFWKALQFKRKVDNSFRKLRSAKSQNPSKQQHIFSILFC